MLILLPPSEGKAEGACQKPEWLPNLSFSEQLSAARLGAISRLGIDVDSLPVASAVDIYNGVLYKALDYGSLTISLRQKANSRILIFSALFGAIRPLDEIPNYKVKMKTSEWSSVLPRALDGIESNLIVDCRSSTYASAWKPNPQITVGVRVFQEKLEKRSVITHMSKKYRGELARALVLNGPVKSPLELHELSSTYFSSELHSPTEKSPWLLNLIIPS